MEKEVFLINRLNTKQSNLKKNKTQEDSLYKVLLEYKNKSLFLFRNKICKVFKLNYLSCLSYFKILHSIKLEKKISFI